MRFRQPNNEPLDLFKQLEHAQRLAAQPRGLDQLAEAVDFEEFREVLITKLGYNRQTDKGGNTPFDPVFMLKIMIIQRFFDLSEEAAAYEITNRFDFMRFLGINPGDPTPAKSTIWDFKEKLGSSGVREVFALFDAKLFEQGIEAKEGSSVDASFIEAPHQRNTRAENEAIKQGELPEGWEQHSPKRLAQKDLDARWAKKNNQTHYGYKNHIKIDNKTKLIRKFLVSPANEHDSQCLSNLLSAEDGALYADSAYQSEATSQRLAELGLGNEVHEKGNRNHPLSEAQKASNKLKSRTRARVEHVFGFIWSMTRGTVRTIGIMRAARQVGFDNFVYNLRRYATLKRQGMMAL